MSAQKKENFQILQGHSSKAKEMVCSKINVIVFRGSAHS